MRRSEMSPKQLENRSVLVAMLRGAGWGEPLEEQDFERGLWLDPVATIEYERDDATLVVGYHAAQEFVHLCLEDSEIGDLALIIHHENRIEDLARLIIAFQDDLSPETAQTHFRQILRRFPKTLVDMGAEPPRRLVDD